MAKIGDISRKRRLGQTAKAKYYAQYRAIRFARRFGGAIQERK